MRSSFDADDTRHDTPQAREARFKPRTTLLTPSTLEQHLQANPNLANLLNDIRVSGTMPQRILQEGLFDVILPE